MIDNSTKVLIKKYFSMITKTGGRRYTNYSN